MRESTAEIGGHQVHWVEDRPGEAPVLYVHGVPDSSGLWAPFLARTGGIALDLPGFGRSGKRPDFPYDIDGYAEFLEAFAAHRGLERVRLVCHDWGGVALAWAMRHPERIERLVAIDVVPFLPGYRWHPWARVWRRRGLGEFAMGITHGWMLRLATGMPREWAARVAEHFDQGTQRAILRLYRSAPPERLEAAGRDLGRIGAPALVLWGERDPYLPVRFGEALAERLPAGEFRLLSEGGHWPWVQDEGVIDLVERFLDG